MIAENPLARPKIMRTYGIMNDDNDYSSSDDSDYSSFDGGPSSGGTPPPHSDGSFDGYVGCIATVIGIIVIIILYRVFS